MRGLRVHISGVVQGVGFRPFVHNLANRYQLKGWVRNTSAGVDIEVDGEQSVLEAFIRALREEAPPLARLDELQSSYRSAAGFTSFEIIHSEPIEGAFQPISPDVAICEDCLRELFDPKDRRFRYPFINCTNCGPRFTIITDIPYDRPNTTMASFAMCPDCKREYVDPTNRRFHAQPIACPVCGPRVWLEPGAASVDLNPFKGNSAASTLPESRGDPFQSAQEQLEQGRILAIKGLGGFHLACDAENPAAVIELRNRKNRVDKPFALMMPEMAVVEKNCHVSDTERKLLTSAARPIVLLRRKTGSKIAREVAPAQDQLGVILPYTPLHYLLFSDEAGRMKDPQLVLVMTSGNLAEEPIAIENEEARQRLSSLADAFLMHDREIHIRCDDSVVRVFEERIASPRQTSRSASKPQVTGLYPVRRSRGYSPFPVKLPFKPPALLATGSELKNTFCITNGDYAFLSQHIGDMENYETLRSFEHGVDHFEKMFRVKPEALAHDLHPDYLATRYALKRSQRENLPLVGIQHHHAHIAACMAEHRMDASRVVIGIAFDGTGFGEDGAIWGGEILIARYKEFQRAMHIEYFPLPGGDAAIKTPARTALALLWSLGLEWDENLAPSRFHSMNELENLRIQLERRINSPMTSSVGRLFDAAASMAGVRQSVNYEAQAAIEFEAMADPEERRGYPFELDGSILKTREAFAALVREALSGVPAPILSARFHNGLAESVLTAAIKVRKDTEIKDVVLSGGVWQNITLLGRTLSLLDSEGFSVYIHREVPTNDGGISLGQAAIAAQRLK